MSTLLTRVSLGLPVGRTVRRWCAVAAIVACVSVQSGCVVPIWSPSPDTRVRQLIYTSEGYRHIPNIWERIWGLDMPDVATPYRTHGGVI